MSYSDDRKEDSKRWSGNGSSGSSADKFSARLYVGRLSRSVTERDIDEAFGKYGRIREVDARGVDGVNGVSPTQQTQVLTQYQFRALDGGRIQGNDDRILVEFARGSTWRGARESRHGSGRSYDGRPPERCFNCGQIGHW
ncbi:5493_t:CDS:2 [Ambispora leptoticha]|uniref:5493_t:CDS:1 n=1 Tax=Ambispora leptoticha TaxID=144679 RepID=A0A9N9EEF2_9GLOM|nr:5493_t:CDS:2 [Ambispora leptoticha]